MKTYQQYLTENRVDVLEKKYHDAIQNWIATHPYWRLYRNSSVQYAFSRLVGTDPTPNKIYLDWIIRVVINSERGFQDLNAIHSDLVDFDRVKRFMPTAERDINKHKKYHDLRIALIPYFKIESKRSIEKNEIAKWKKQIETVYDGPEGKVLIPWSYEASKFLGRGTKWCTAMESTREYYDHYTNHGGHPLWVFVDPDGTKWQYHAYPGDMAIEMADGVADGINSFQFADERDINSHTALYTGNFKSRIAACAKRGPDSWILTAVFMRMPALYHQCAKALKWDLDGFRDEAAAELNKFRSLSIQDRITLKWIVDNV